MLTRPLYLKHGKESRRRIDAATTLADIYDTISVVLQRACAPRGEHAGICTTVRSANTWWLCAYQSHSLIRHLGLRWITQEEGVVWVARGHIVVALFDIANHHSLRQRDLFAAFVRQDIRPARAELPLPVPRSCPNLDNLCGGRQQKATSD